MKIEYSLLTLLSASLIAAAPAPYVVTDSVLATGTENVAVPVTDLDQRQQISVYGFRKRTLELRNALLAARNNNAQGAQERANEDGQALGEANAEAASPAAPKALAAAGNATEPAAGKGKGKGKGKGHHGKGKGKGKGAAAAAAAAGNATEPAVGKGKGKGKGKAHATLLGAKQAGGNATGMCSCGSVSGMY